MIEGLVVLAVIAGVFVLIKRSKAKKGSGTPGTGNGGGSNTGNGSIDQKEIQ